MSKWITIEAAELAVKALEERIKELEIKNKQLIKAGDDLVLQVEWRNVVFTDPTLSFCQVKSDCLCNCHNFDEAIALWHAAKEGKFRGTHNDRAI